MALGKYWGKFNSWVCVEFDWGQLGVKRFF